MWWDLAYKVFNFAVLVFLLYWFVRKPLGSFLKRRQESIKQTIEEAEIARKEGEKKYQEYEEKVEKLDQALGKSMDRLMVALVLTGWLVGSAIASTVDVSLGTFRLSDLAFYMFLIGAVVGAVVAIQAITRLNKEIEEG